MKKSRELGGGGVSDEEPATGARTENPNEAGVAGGAIEAGAVAASSRQTPRRQVPRRIAAVNRRAPVRRLSPADVASTPHHLRSPPDSQAPTHTQAPPDPQAPLDPQAEHGGSDGVRARVPVSQRHVPLRRGAALPVAPNSDSNSTLGELVTLTKRRAPRRRQRSPFSSSAESGSSWGENGGGAVVLSSSVLSAGSVLRGDSAAFLGDSDRSGAISSSSLSGLSSEDDGNTSEPRGVSVGGLLARPV